MSGGIDPRLLLLSPADNVVVARENLPAGTEVQVGGQAVRLEKDIARGHKLACRAIMPGDKVMKYGAPIGSAIVTIAPGEHVHVHNIKSDYTATHVIGSPAVEAA
jgi:hypothetical protein